jgi:MoxR-like ATPase
VIALSKAIAQLHGRDYVVPKDVQEVFVQAVAHRVQLAPGQEETAQQLLADLLKTIPAPKLI